MITLTRPFDLPAVVKDELEHLTGRLRAFLLKEHNDDGTHLPFTGYQVGEGATVIQATSKSTGVSVNAHCGQITLHAANLAANTTVSFTFTNLKIERYDVLALNHYSGGTAGSYVLNAQCRQGSASINVRNVTAGGLAEAIVIAFVVVTSQIH